jgi:GTP-binding protein HflX
LNDLLDPTRETAILVGVQTPNMTADELREGLDELELLADTAGADAAARITQSLPSVKSTTFVGKGKVEEIKALVERHEADVVLFDDDLTPVQVRNLQKALEVKLVDRSGLILDIFARRARSSQARAQVELAQLEYLRSRLTRAWTHLERQKGGIGMRGPGETQIETDRRLIGRRIAVLKEQLERIDKQRTTQRKGRAEQTLFATLDATTRQVYLAPNKAVLLADTVGFIRKLPHALVESFKSTLDEVREADLLLHVVDVTHRAFEDHIGVVRQTLDELGAGDKPTLMVFNKVDALEDRGLIDRLRAEFEPVAFISAARGIGLDELRAQTVALVEAEYVERTALLPVSEAKARAHLHSVAQVLSEEVGMAADAFTEGAAPEPVFLLRYRVSTKNAADLDRMLARYGSLRRIDDDAADEAPVPDAAETAV